MVWMIGMLVGIWLLFVALKLESIDNHLKWFRDRQRVRDNNPVPLRGE